MLDITGQKLFDPIKKSSVIRRSIYDAVQNSEVQTAYDRIATSGFESADLMLKWFIKSKIELTGEDALTLALWYCVHVESAQEIHEQWAAVAEAAFWQGVLFAKSPGNPASALAKKRHAENYALTADAIKYWRENIDPSLSASKAADELLRVLPLSHRKLTEIVSAEKKKKP